MKKTQDPGFTLLELIVVVLVIAMTMALAYPSLSRGSSSLHLRSCSRDVLNIFRYAKEKAITQQQGMVVLVDADQQAITLYNNLGDLMDQEYLMPNDVQIYRIALAGEEVTSGSMLVRFLANGSADFAEVILRSNYGSQLMVVCDPLRGGSRIESQGESDQ
jgi:prepilin-type N-terminal cleavage/methylation domain-containing protein